MVKKNDKRKFKYRAQMLLRSLKRAPSPLILKGFPVSYRDYVGRNRKTEIPRKRAYMVMQRKDYAPYIKLRSPEERS